MKTTSKKNLAKLPGMDMSNEESGSLQSVLELEAGYQIENNWEVGQKVMCLSGDNLFYEAKILGISDYEDEPIYTIHYVGWNAKYDEKIRQSESSIRFKKFTQQSKREAETQLKKARGELDLMQSLKKPKRKRSKNSEQPRTTLSHPTDRRNSRNTGIKSKSIVEVKVGPPVESLALCVPANQQHMVQPIQLNGCLRSVLVQDMEYHRDHGMLPRIPAKVSVFNIIEMFRLYLKSFNLTKEERRMPVIPKEHSQTSNWVNVMVHSFYNKEDLFTISLLDCFEYMAGTGDLLYEHEKPMHVRLLHQLDNGEMLSQRFTANEQYKLAKLFGLPHLLRMLTLMHKPLAESCRLKQQDVDRLMSRCSGLVQFLSENLEGCYKGSADYYLPSTTSNLRK